MWLVIKAELKYNLSAFILFSALFFILQATEVILIIDNSKSASGIGIFLFILLSFSVQYVWLNRIKENQIRLLALLPFSKKNIAIIRYWFNIIPLVGLLGYYIISHYLLLLNYNINTAIPFTQVGIALISITGICSVYDNRFSDSNLWIRTKKMLFTVIILTPILLSAYFISPLFQKNPSAAISIIFEIAFFLICVITMLITIFSYQKRKSYLS